MAIRVPTERTYYQSSPIEPDYLLCWIPREELEDMVRKGEAVKDVLKNYPYGLEIEVSEEALEEVGIKLNISPDSIRKAYTLLREENCLDKSGYVRGKALERFVEYMEMRPEVRTVPFELTKFPAPEMSDGEEPLFIFQHLTMRGGR